MNLLKIINGKMYKGEYNMDKVNIVKYDEYNVEDIMNQLLDPIDNISFSDDDIVIIKPNLCDLKGFDKGVTTNPRIVQEVIKYIRKRSNPKIFIIESNHWIANAEEEFERLGYNELAKKFDVKLINLSREKYRRIDLNGKYFETFNASNILLKATKFISISKLKTHVQFKISCILKNQFGLIRTKYKSKYHPFMNEVLYDINSMFKPDLCIVDAVTGMQGPGPADGTPIHLGLLISGTNPVSVDSVAAQIAGFNPRSVPYLKYSEKKGLGSTSNYEPVGLSVDKVKQKFVFIPFLSYVFYRMSLKLLRAGISMNNFFDRLSEIADLFATGILAWKRGFILSAGSGMTRFSDGKLYLKEILKRMFFYR